MLRFRPSEIKEQPSTGGSTQQSFDIPLPIPSFFSPFLFPDRANLKRSFPRDFIQPDDRKRPLVQTGTVWKSFSSPRRISLLRGFTRASTTPSTTNFLSRFPRLPRLLPSFLLRRTSSLSLSVEFESTRKKGNFPRFV